MLKTEFNERITPITIEDFKTNLAQAVETCDLVTTEKMLEVFKDRERAKELEANGVTIDSLYNGKSLLEMATEASIDEDLILEDTNAKIRASRAPTIENLYKTKRFKESDNTRSDFASKQRAEMIKLLLSNKADPNIICSDGSTPLGRACSICETLVVYSFFGDKRTDFNMPDSYNRTPMYNVMHFIKTTEQLNLKTRKGRKSGLNFMIPSSYEDDAKEIVRILLLKNANPHVRADDAKDMGIKDKTAFEMSKSIRDKHFHGKLRNIGADNRPIGLVPN